jgi:hypothetical protein
LISGGIDRLRPGGEQSLAHRNSLFVMIAERNHDRTAVAQGIFIDKDFVSRESVRQRTFQRSTGSGAGQRPAGTHQGSGIQPDGRNWAKSGNR